jgi:hypothetical protein
MKKGMMMLMVVAAAMVSFAPIQAGAFTYDLTTVINGDIPYVHPSIDWGDFSVTTGTGADAGKVIVSVTLSDASWRIQEFGFNYQGGPAPGTFALTGIDISYTPNANKPDGYHYFLDFKVPDNGNLGNVSTFTGILSIEGENLNESYFDYKDTGNLIYAYVHIGSLGEDGDDSIWVGTGTQVPEPGTLLLLGSGLLGMVLIGRKNFRG